MFSLPKKKGPEIITNLQQIYNKSATNLQQINKFSFRIFSLFLRLIANFLNIPFGENKTEKMAIIDKKKMTDT